MFAKRFQEYSMLRKQIPGFDAALRIQAGYDKITINNYMEINPKI